MYSRAGQQRLSGDTGNIFYQLVLLSGNIIELLSIGIQKLGAGIQQEGVVSAISAGIPLPLPHEP